MCSATDPEPVFVAIVYGVSGDPVDMEVVRLEDGEPEALARCLDWVKVRLESDLRAIRATIRHATLGGEHDVAEFGPVIGTFFKTSGGGAD